MNNEEIKNFMKGKPAPIDKLPKQRIPMPLKPPKIEKDKKKEGNKNKCRGKVIDE